MFRAATIAFLLLVIVAFTAANWAVFNAPTLLTLGFMDFTAPLGVLMLFALAMVTLVFLASMALWQARILADTRRHTRELAQHRALADEAEASRFTALRALLQQETQRLELRLDAAEAAVRGEIHDGVNSIAALVGEMDDHLNSGQGAARNSGS
jgi:hypothetical protein